MNAVHELDVYVLSEQLSDMVWHDFDSWPRKAQEAIGYQMIDSSDSIAANISEGYGRFTSADRKRHYYYSRGSFEETKAWLRKAIRRHLIGSQQRIQAYADVINELGPKLNAFIRNT